MGGGQCVAHLVAADGGAARAPVVQGGEPRGHQGEARQQAEHHHGEEDHDRTELGRVVLDGGDGLPHGGDHRGGHGADEPAAAERREVPEQDQRQDERGRDGGEPRDARPVVGVRGGPRGEHAQPAGGEQEGRRQPQVALPDPGDDRSGGHQDERERGQGAGQRLEGELPAREERGGHREGDGRHARAAPPGGGTPAPGAQVEVVGHQVGDVVDHGGGRCGVAPDEAQDGTVGHTGRRERAVVRQRGTVRGDQLTGHRT